MFGLFRSIMDRHRKDKKCKRRGRKRHSPLGKGRSLWPRLCFELLEERELLAITVNSLLDSSAIDLTTGWTDTIGTITLRSAVESAVNLGGNQTIDFNITVTGPFIIQPGSALPTLSEDSITIDATTQSGIIVDGASAVGTTHGFVIAAADCAIKGLTIQNFSGAGIKIAGAGSDELVLDIPTFTLQFDAYTPAALTTVNGAAPGTGLGTLNSAHGTTIEENNILNNGLHGILISHASVNTIIDNTISGTTAGPGIEIIGDDDLLVVSTIDIGGEAPSDIALSETITITSTANRNTIVGNTIDDNAEDGVLIAGASYNRLGGTGAAEGNTITNNAGNGIQITGTVLQIEQEGQDVTDGRQWIPPASAPSPPSAGVDPLTRFAGVVGLGMHSEGEFSLLPPTPIDVITTGSVPTYNRVQGNYIGTNEDGDSGLGNEHNGILIGPEARLTVIGSQSIVVPGSATSMPDEGNVIAGNDGNGIHVVGNPLNAHPIEEEIGNYGLTGGTFDFGASFENNIPTFELLPTIIAGNSIGMDADGIDALGNGAAGVFLENARAFVIDNVIVASTGAGLEIDGTPQWALYLPGTDAQGDLVPAPALDLTSVAQGNKIGVGWDGVQWEDANNTPYGNGGDGVLLAGGAQYNFIGPLFDVTEDQSTSARAMAERQGNVIAQSDRWGVHVEGIGVFHAQEPNNDSPGDPFLFPTELAHPYGTQNNIIVANQIGVDASGVQARGNTLGGVLVDNAAALTVIGEFFLPLERQWYGNVISGNGGPGVEITDRGTWITILGGNFIGVGYDRLTGDGDTPLGNDVAGVRIANEAMATNVGGDGTYASLGSRNYIAANDGPGVLVENTYDVTLAVLDDATPGYSIGDFNDIVHGELSDLVTTEEINASINEIDNCWIGLGVQIGFDQNGTPISWDPVPLGNDGDGIEIIDASHTLLGGFHPAYTTNTIAANDGDGVSITGTTGNNKAWLNYLIQNNIGIDPTGPSADPSFANTGNGVRIEGTATYNVVQGAGFTEVKYLGQLEYDLDVELFPEWMAQDLETTFDVAENGNVIGNNDGNGIHIEGADNNIIGGGNFIGTDLTGLIDLANDQNGVLISGDAQDNVLVPWARIDLINPYNDDPDDPNSSPWNSANFSYTAEASVIANNGGAGVRIEGLGAIDNIVSGANPIRFGSLSSPYFATAANQITNNALGGVVIANGASDNTVDGTISGAGNVITGNGDALTNLAGGIWINEQDVLLVAGTAGDDQLVLTSPSGGINVDFNGDLLAYKTTSSQASVVAFGHDGDDEIDATVKRSILVGGAGADTFNEYGYGESILVTGEMTLSGQALDDAALEWASAGSGHAFVDRVANLNGTGLSYTGTGFVRAGETVLDDGEVDKIFNHKLNDVQANQVGKTWYFLGFRDDEYHSDEAPQADEVFSNISSVIVAAEYFATPSEHAKFTFDAGAAVRHDDDDDIVRDLATDMGYTIYSYVIDWDNDSTPDETLPGGTSGGDVAAFEGNLGSVFLSTIEVEGHTTDAHAMTTLFVVGTQSADLIFVVSEWDTTGDTYVIVDNGTPWGTEAVLDSVVMLTLAGDDDIAFLRTTVNFTTVVDTGDGNDFAVVFEGAENEYHLTGGVGDDALWLMEGSDTRVTLLGGDGADELLLFESDATTAVISGGAESDIIINLAAGSAILRATGDDGDDVLIGGAGADELEGGAGEDVIIGGVFVDDGDDTLLGGEDDDVLIGSDGADSLNAGAGEDLIVTGWLSDEMYGDEDNPGFLQAYTEWLQSGSVQQRMDRLQGLQTPITCHFNPAFYLVPGVTVINDTHVDLIMAGLGEADGVFYDSDYDSFPDKEAEDVTVDIS